MTCFGSDVSDLAGTGLGKHTGAPEPGPEHESKGQLL